MTNAGLGLILAAILAADTAVTATHHGTWGFELTVGAIVCLLALARGRSPMWIAVTGLTVCGVAAVVADVAHRSSQPGAAALAALLVLAAACIRVASARPALAVAIAGVVVMVVGRVDVRREYIVPLALLDILLWGMALAVGVWLRILDVRRRLAIDAARRHERLELARELHDIVAHHVAGIVVQAQAARLVAARRPEILAATLAEIESAGIDALTAMRRVVGLLRDSEDAVGLTPGPERFSDLVDRFARRGLAVELHLAATDHPSWPPAVDAAVYRVTQEALTNVVLHAPRARAVTVTVGRESSGVSIEIADDGTAGPSPFTSRNGFGLMGMRERVEALGGTLSAGPRPDGGWVVRADIPLPAGDNG